MPRRSNIVMIPQVIGAAGVVSPSAECLMQLLGKKFRRQLVDFFCMEYDRAPPFSELWEEYEAERTRFLEAESIVILRVENIEAVLETIREAVRKPEADHPCRADNLR